MRKNDLKHQINNLVEVGNNLNLVADYLQDNLDLAVDDYDDYKGADVDRVCKHFDIDPDEFDPDDFGFKLDLAYEALDAQNAIRGAIGTLTDMQSMLKE